MPKLIKKTTLTLTAIWSAFLVCTTSGCASGGYKLTRKYSSWVNKNNIVLRVVLYLLTGIVYAVTMLIDMVIFNTMDFWNGRVSQGNYQFNKEDRTYFVRHSIDQDSGLRQSRIEVSKDNHTIQTVVLRETASLEVELLVDGVLRGKATDLKSLPLLSLYDQKGVRTSQQPLWPKESFVSAR